MQVIFSDLDGTLLHPQTYSFDPAKPALSMLRRQNTPLVLCTSKTRAEVEVWLKRLRIRHPFIVENGGAVYIPRGYFSFEIGETISRDDYQVIQFGTPYWELVLTLQEAAKESGCEVLGFHEMSVADISLRTSLPVSQAELAKRREYDEPFEIHGVGTHTLLAAIERRGKRWTRGDRFYHVTGANDKAVAVDCLSRLYRREFGALRTIGLGDGHNDAQFLMMVDFPVIIQSRFAAALKQAVPRADITSAPGPHGWNEAIMPFLAPRKPPTDRRAGHGTSLAPA